MKPLARVLKAQCLISEAHSLLAQARALEPNRLLRTSLLTAERDLIATERSLDAVTHALRDIADPTRGVR